MSEPLKRMPLANVEITNSLEQESYVLIVQNGETFKIPTSKVLSENEKDVYVKDAYIESGHLFIVLSNGEKKDAGIIQTDTKKYGVCYDFKSKNPKLTRLGDAKYLRAEIANGVNDTDVVNDFDKIYPWSDMKRCTMADDGTITSYEGDPNYTENGSIGQVMTEIPEHYEMKYISEATGKMYYYVSSEKLNEHYKFVPKKYIASFLIGYSSTETMGSIGGNCYSTSFKLAEARNYAKARGTNWHLFDVWDYETVKTLFLIEFATLNSQSLFDGYTSDVIGTVDVYPNEECMKDVLAESNVITDTEFSITSFVSQLNDFSLGDEILLECISNNNPDELDFSEDNGDGTRFYYAIRKIIAAEPVDTTAYPDYPDAMKYYISGNAVTIGKSSYCSYNNNRNGQTNEIKASSGRVIYQGNQVASVWRGIENLTGLETVVWLDGILLKDGKYWVCNDVSQYANSIYASDADGNATEEYKYTQISFDCPNIGYVTKMGYDEATGLTLPIEMDGTSDTGYCDSCTFGASTTYTFPFAFGGDSEAISGLFRMIANLTPANVRKAQFYARISYCKNEEVN